MNKIMVFPRIAEFDKAKAKLDKLNLKYEVIEPSLTYEGIAVPAIVFEQDTYSNLISDASNEFVFFCVDYRQPLRNNFECEIETFTDDVFGNVYIMSLTPCIANENKIRVIAHLSKDIAHVLPYLNTHLKSASYNKDAEILTFMDQYRIISLYNNKIAIAQLDEITDAWRVLGRVRALINNVNSQKNKIVPSYEMRRKPSALAIYNRLPKINCGECGQKTCMAFAVALWGGNAYTFSCKPMFEGEFTHLLDAFSDISVGLL